MKKIAKVLSALLCLALAIGMTASVTFAAGEYAEIKINSSQIMFGKYDSLAMTGDVIWYDLGSTVNAERACLVDNKGNSAAWSKPFKYDDLKDNGGNIVPAFRVDLTKDGQPTNVARLDMQLRSYFDCFLTHFEIQVATDAAATKWVSVYEGKNVSWDSIMMSFTFDQVAAYQIRVVVYNLGDPSSNDDALKGDETRFALSEIDLYSLVGGSSGGNGGSSSGGDSGSTGGNGGSSSGGDSGSTGGNGGSSSGGNGGSSGGGDSSSETGDINIAALTALMVVSAIGAGTVLCKKKRS